MKKKRPDSALLQKNGGIIRLKGIFFSKHFGLIHLAGLRVLKHFFGKKSPLSLFISPFIFSLLFHPVSSLVLLILSSCLLSSLLSIFSCLVSSSLFFSCLLFSFLVLSLFLCLSVSLCFCLSLSLCLSVSVWCCVLCCVLCCVVLYCVCGVVCGAAGHAENASVCRFKTSPCVPAPRGCVTTCGRGVGTHGDVLNLHTETFFIGKKCDF